MKTMKILIASFVCCVCLSVGSFEVNAEKGYYPNKYYTVDLCQPYDYEISEISVTVPISLNLDVNMNTINNSVLECEITNESNGMIELSDIMVETNSNWSFVSADSDFSEVGSNLCGLTINDNDVLIDMYDGYKSSSPIVAGDSKVLTLLPKLSPPSGDLRTSLMSLSYVVEWYETSDNSSDNDYDDSFDASTEIEVMYDKNSNIYVGECWLAYAFPDNFSYDAYVELSRDDNPWLDCVANGWKMVSYDTDFSEYPVNSKFFGIGVINEGYPYNVMPQVMDLYDGYCYNSLYGSNPSMTIMVRTPYRTKYDSLGDVRLISSLWFNIEAHTYDVVFHMNGGAYKGSDVYESNQGDMWVDDGWSVEVNYDFYDDVTPVRNGYKFLGWSEDINANTPDSDYIGYLGYKISCFTEDTDLYAVWQKL